MKIGMTDGGRVVGLPEITVLLAVPAEGAFYGDIAVSPTRTFLVYCPRRISLPWIKVSVHSLARSFEYFYTRGNGS